MTYRQGRAKILHEEEKPQCSILGFIVNITAVLFWLAVFGFGSFIITKDKGYLIDMLLFLGPSTFSSVVMISFHLYAMINREYGNKKEDQNLDFGGILKKHWAIIVGTTLSCLSTGYFGYVVFWEILGAVNEPPENAFIALALVLVIISFSLMICWGYVTDNKKNILARCVRPWQIDGNTESVIANTPEVQSNILQQEEEKPQYSILGFIINIIAVVFWLVVFAFCFTEMFSSSTDLSQIMFLFGPFSLASIILIGFHLYVMINPEFGNKKEDQELGCFGSFKKYWAIIIGTTLSCVMFSLKGWVLIGIASNNNEVGILATLTLLILSFSVMICWGFVTDNKKNILARLVRPWQVYENTEVNTYSV